MVIRPIVMSIAMAVLASVAVAQPGSLITEIPLPVPGFGVSVGVGYDGLGYYTIGDNNLYVMDAGGALVNTLPVTDSVTGAGLNMDELAWDNSRGIFWAQLHDSNPVDVYQIDPTTGVATFAFTSATNSVGLFRNGIAYDSSDDTIWISGDVSTTVEHYNAADGSFINQITPQNAQGSTLGSISGVSVGVGDLLYLGQNGQVQIVQVRKSDGGFVASFASPGGTRDEGLECDDINFAPLVALWSRDIENNLMSIIELEAGTCAPCPVFLGACCVGETCLDDTSVSDCLDLGGRWEPNVMCSDPCFCGIDCNNNGIIDACDLCSVMDGAAAAGSPAGAQLGGPLVLMGIDAEDFNGANGADHGGKQPYIDVTNGILGQVTSGGSGILVIGAGKNANDDVTGFWNAIGASVVSHAVRILSEPRP